MPTRLPQGTCQVSDHWQPADPLVLHCSKAGTLPTYDYMHHQEQLFDCVEKGLLRMTMELPTKKEKIKQIFFDAEEASTKLRGDT
jgi:hypothetical protein